MRCQDDLSTWTLKLPVMISVFGMEREIVLQVPESSKIANRSVGEDGKEGQKMIEVIWLDTTGLKGEGIFN